MSDSKDNAEKQAEYVALLNSYMQLHGDRKTFESDIQLQLKKQAMMTSRLEE